MCPACFLALLVSTVTSSWMLFRKQIKKFIKRCQHAITKDGDATGSGKKNSTKITKNK